MIYIEEMKDEPIETCEISRKQVNLPFLEEMEYV